MLVALPVDAIDPCCTRVLRVIGKQEAPHLLLLFLAAFVHEVPPTANLPGRGELRSCERAAPGGV